MLFRYKPDDGRNARQIAFWLGEAFFAFGSMAFSGLLQRFESLRSPVLSAFPEIPVFKVALTGSFLLAFGLFIALSYLWVRYLAGEKAAQHLIEVEGEINKVTWPTFKEASNSSIVVIITVIILMAFLALADILLGKFFDTLLY